ncbi:Hypothetical predicted protein [Cloeon dipterum]|uniref:Serpin domain-containing protein n=1 Tax=Cloeon dipterum TaxID=197152 RepID=A0A8S1CS36_9INSE|nr:Hypothetical predicted protein [Cloeon dipterum]
MNLLVILHNKYNGLYKLTEKIDHLCVFNKIESTIDLKPYLREMGLADIFEAPDLSGITAEKLRVSKVIQKAVIEVNEEGTVASASSAVGAINRMISKLVFRCDHPFFFS